MPDTMEKQFGIGHLRSSLIQHHGIAVRLYFIVSVSAIKVGYLQCGL